MKTKVEKIINTELPEQVYQSKIKEVKPLIDFLNDELQKPSFARNNEAITKAKDEVKSLFSSYMQSQQQKQNSQDELIQLQIKGREKLRELLLKTDLEALEKHIAEMEKVQNSHKLLSISEFEGSKVTAIKRAFIKIKSVLEDKKLVGGVR